MKEMEEKLNEKQKELLKSIVNDKFSVGAFSGMIFNAQVRKDNFLDTNTEHLVKKALDVRLTMQEMIK